LESAAKAVTDNTKLLVKTVEKVRVQAAEAAATTVDYTKMSAHEFKRREMEQQVKILTLEKNLDDSRAKLSEMRRYAYHHDNDYVVESTPIASKSNSELNIDPALPEGQVGEDGAPVAHQPQQQGNGGKKGGKKYKR
jgi:hypothetical protein